MGIDPGTTGMGFALLDPSTEPAAILHCGVVATPVAGTAADRLVAIADALDSLIARYAPVAIAVERLYFNRNAKTAMAVAEARGIALLCAARAGVAVAEYTPQQVKLSVAGDGAADKKAVQRMVATVLALRTPVVQDNVADAIAIALTHAQRVRLDRAVARAGG